MRSVAEHSSASSFGINASNQFCKEKKQKRPRHLRSGIVHEEQVGETLLPSSFVYMCV